MIPYSATPRRNMGSVRAAAVAGQQWGVIGLRQLERRGVSDSTVRRWRADGKLHLIFGTVYSLGHSSVPIEGLMVAALLHAGDGAVLSHATAAWWWGLIDEQPQVVDVSTIMHSRSVPGKVRVHRRRRQFDPTRLRRFPITTVAQTLLDYAATAPLQRLRRALAEADYRHLLNLKAVEAVLGQGRPGTANLRRALKAHQPRLALTRSRLERAFLRLCESAGIEIPEINAQIAGWTVDALWRDVGLVVELDGYGNHHTPAQLRRDRRKELALRSAGLIVVRYSEEQVLDEPRAVAADARAQRATAARSA